MAARWDIYRALRTCSKRALARTKRQAYHRGWQRPHIYQPQGDLLNRLSLEFGMGREEVFQALLELRAEILSRGGRI